MENTTMLTLNDTEERDQASAIMQRLFAEKCIVPAKSPQAKEDYDFVNRHTEYFEELLDRCGFELRYVTAKHREAISFRPKDGTANNVKMNKRMSLTIVYLRGRCEEAAASVAETLAGTNNTVTISLQEFLSDVIIDKKTSGEKQEKEYMQVLRQLTRYNLIELDTPRGADASNQTITIYPSIRLVLEKAGAEAIHDKLMAYQTETGGRRKRPDIGGTAENDGDDNSDTEEEEDA